MLNIEQQQIILTVLKPFQPLEVAVFGSFARGEETSESDIDLLVDFGNERLTLLDLVHIGDELESKLGRKVDLVTKRGLSPLLKPYIEQDLVLISHAA